MTDIQEQSVSRKPAPTRSAQFDMQGFASWLAMGGAEIGIPSNPYEVIRYRSYPYGGGKLQTHIVYRKETDELTWCGESRAHYGMFKSGCAFTEQPRANPAVFLTTYPTETAKVKLKSEVRRESLLARDGDECWFCGDPLGDDITIEHLVPKSVGGRNMLANYALAHADCNHRAANKPLIQKIELRNKLRGK